MQWWCVAQATPWEWEWRAYPGVWLFLLLLGAARVILVRRTDASDTRGRRWSFGVGILLLWLALDWPIGVLGAGYLASAHMVQFLLIALAAPPLLLLGVPPGAWDAAPLPGLLRRTLARLTHPLAALLFFAVTMAWTHWPPVVDTWMRSQLGSFALDTVWLAAGVVFWWPVTVPRSEPSWFGYPAMVGYLILATIMNTGIFMYLTYAELPLYRIYELAPPISWLTTRQDQVLAGVLMKLGGGVVLWSAITVLFGLWYLEGEKETGAGP